MSTLTAEQYHAIINRAKHDLMRAPYASSTAYAIQEEQAARRIIANTFITSAPPMPGMSYIGEPDKWKPKP